MNNFIDKIKHLITPTVPNPEETIKELQAKTQNLEQQAEYAETEAKLIERSIKAKKRIKAARKSNMRSLYPIAGLVLLVFIILVIAGSC